MRRLVVYNSKTEEFLEFEMENCGSGYLCHIQWIDEPRIGLTFRDEREFFSNMGSYIGAEVAKGIADPREKDELLSFKGFIDFMHFVPITVDPDTEEFEVHHSEAYPIKLA